MELWRHTYDGNAWCSQPSIISSLKDFGFVNADGTEIDESNPTSGTIGTGNWYWEGLKWKYDKTASATTNNFSISFNASTPNEWGGGTLTVNDIIFNSQSGNKYYFTHSSLYYPDGQDHRPTPLKAFFIPLVNNGFLFTTRKNELNYGDSGGELNDPDGFLNYGQTPRLITDGSVYGCGYGSNKTIIGLPPTNSNFSTGYFYIIFDNSGTQKTCTIETSDGIDRPLNFTDGNLSGIDGYHTDVTQNVCTLVKYPYEGGFIDNLYIMTTSPTNFTTDVGFFSMNGRNYMKVFRNIVVELPSTT